MTAVKAHDVQRAVSARSADVAVLLFYGPDAGLVSEQARAAARAAVDDPDDAFQLVRIEADRLADEPALLIEEASTYGLFGGRRAILVRAGSRSVAAAVEPCLAAKLIDVTIVIEAGDLSKAAPLRVLCERSRGALSLPCYADEGKNLAALVAETLQAHGLEIEADARDLLIESLGANRLTSRSELDKLVLYAAGRTTIVLADIEAAVSDASAMSIPALVDSAFDGHVEDVDARLRQASQGGLPSAGILIAALRHAFLLLGSAGGPNGMRSGPRVFGRRQDVVERQASRWPAPKLLGCIAALQQATLDSRRQSTLATAIVEKSLLEVARTARRLKP